jgi:hypothetical protein
MEQGAMTADNTPNPRAVIGGNAAPIPDQLALAYEQLETEVAEALTYAREQLPPSVESDDDVALIATFVKDRVKPTKSRIDAAEELEKRPLMNATDAVRGFFRAKVGRLDKAMEVINKRVTAYNDKKRAAAAAAAAAEAQKRREEEAQARAAAEEARLNADRARASELAAQAQVAAIKARDAEKLADAKPAVHTRVKAAGGATATTTTFWDHEVLDLQAIPPAILWPFISDEAKRVAIGAFVRAGNRELAGVRIFENTRPNYR